MQPNQISIDNQALSPLDRQLLNAVSMGASNKHIALMLAKSEFTVRNRLSRVFKKINVLNRAHAAVWYRDYAAQKSGLQGVEDGEPPVESHAIQAVVTAMKKHLDSLR